MPFHQNDDNGDLNWLPQGSKEEFFKLRAIRQVLKELPNLPKGKLRDNLESSLANVCDPVASTPVCNDESIDLERAEAQIESLKRKLENIQDESDRLHDISTRSRKILITCIVISLVTGFIIRCML